MPGLASLMNKIAELINNKQDGEVLFTSLDMLYAYGQIELHRGTAKRCNFKSWEEKRRAHMHST